MAVGSFGKTPDLEINCITCKSMQIKMNETKTFYPDNETGA